MMIDRRIFAAACVLGALLLGAASQASAQSQSLPVKPHPADKTRYAASPQAVPPNPAGQALRVAHGAEPESGDVVARVGDTNLTSEQVRAFIAGLSARDRAALAQDPSRLSQAVRLMLTSQLVLKEALAKKWDQQPSTIAQLNRLRESAIIETYLQSVSAPPANYPSDAEVEALYESKKPAFLVPRQFSLAQIFIAAPQGAAKEIEEKARQKLEDVQKKLKQPGADFAAIAHADSDDKASSEKGGTLGWLGENEMRPEIRSQVAGLAKNAVTEPVRLDDGWHLIKLIDTKATYTRPIAEVRAQLVQHLREERAAALQRAYLAKLVEQTPLAINELALSKLMEAPSREPTAK